MEMVEEGSGRVLSKGREGVGNGERGRDGRSGNG